ncbi:MAG: hypothetical protein HAW66_05375 [Shewanella sp.]|nr:hypothetical protein [Shewanella sp.]
MEIALHGTHRLQRSIEISDKRIDRIKNASCYEDACAMGYWDQLKCWFSGVDKRQVCIDLYMLTRASITGSEEIDAALRFTAIRNLERLTTSYQTNSSQATSYQPIFTTTITEGLNGRSDVEVAFTAAVEPIKFTYNPHEIDLINTLSQYANKNKLNISPEQFSSLIEMLKSAELSSNSELVTKFINLLNEIQVQLAISDSYDLNVYTTVIGGELYVGIEGVLPPVKLKNSPVSARIHAEEMVIALSDLVNENHVDEVRDCVSCLTIEFKPLHFDAAQKLSALKRLYDMMPDQHKSIIKVEVIDNRSPFSLPKSTLDDSLFSLSYEIEGIVPQCCLGFGGEKDYQQEIDLLYKLPFSNGSGILPCPQSADEIDVVDSLLSISLSEDGSVNGIEAHHAQRIGIESVSEEARDLMVKIPNMFIRHASTVLKHFNFQREIEEIFNSAGIVDPDAPPKWYYQGYQAVQQVRKDNSLRISESTSQILLGAALLRRRT